MSASKNRPWLRFIKRDTLQERGGGKVLRTFRGEAAYVRRLRRLELVVLSLTMKMALPPKLLDKMLDEMVELKDVVEPTAGSGSEDEGGSTEVPHSGPPGGQIEGNDDASG